MSEQPSSTLETMRSQSRAITRAGAVFDQKELEKFRKSSQGKRLKDWALEAYRNSKSQRAKDEAQWNLNLSMYFGNQWAKISNAADSQGKLYTPPVPKHRTRKTINRIKPLIRTEIARLLAQKPGATVIPNSADDEDMMAALAGEQVWESLSRRRQYRDEIAKAIFWTTTTGTGFVKTYWDEYKYDKISKINGDIVFGAVSPYHLLVPDLREQDIEGQPYVITVSTKSIDWLYSVYGDQIKKLGIKPTVVSDNSILEGAYINLRSDNKAKPDSCMVYEVWVKPGGSRFYPQGGHMIIVDNIIMSITDGLPYEHGEYPFAKFEHVPTSKFYAESVIVDTIELQREYNEIRSQIADSRKKMGKPQFVAPKGSISAAKITNETGLVIEYKPGHAPPTPIPLAEIPSYIIQEQDRVLLDIEDISGQHQVSKGNTPPGVTAATAISYLQERDESYLEHTYASIESATEKIATHTLGLAVQFWEEERLVKVVGEDSSFDALMLKGSELVNGTDIRIEPGSALPESKSAKQAFVLDLMNMGHIESNEGMKLLEVGGAQKIMERLNNDERQAQRENIKLKSIAPEDIAQFQQQWEMYNMQGDNPMVDQTGEVMAPPPIVPVNSYDNHEVHIEVHNRFRRSQTFEVLSPEVKAQFELHVEMHKQEMMKQTIENFMQQIPSDGTDETAPDAGQAIAGGEISEEGPPEQGTSVMDEPEAQFEQETGGLF